MALIPRLIKITAVIVSTFCALLMASCLPAPTATLLPLQTLTPQQTPTARPHPYHRLRWLLT